MEKITEQELIIKRLNVDDVPAILIIERLSFSLPWTEGDYRRELTENQLAHYYGCFEGSKLIAFAGFWQILDEGHIANVAVHPLSRAKGIGKVLMQHIMAASKALGGERMTLEVRATNTVAQKLYQNLGFKDVGIRPKYYSDNNEDAVIMWGNLD